MFYVFSLSVLIIIGVGNVMPAPGDAIVGSPTNVVSGEVREHLWWHGGVRLCAAPLCSSSRCGVLCSSPWPVPLVLVLAPQPSLKVATRRATLHPVRATPLVVRSGDCGCCCAIPSGIMVISFMWGLVFNCL